MAQNTECTRIRRFTVNTAKGRACSFAVDTIVGIRTRLNAVMRCRVIGVKRSASRATALNMQFMTCCARSNPDIADVVVVSGSEVLLVGKSPGVTTLHIWTVYSRQSYEVEVAVDNLPLANELKSILGYPNIRISKINKIVILEGTVHDQYQKKRAESVASAYGEQVVNLLELTKPVQVKLEAKILEINKEKIKNIGVKWGNSPSTGTGIFAFGQAYVNNSTIGGNPLAVWAASMKSMPNWKR